MERILEEFLEFVRTDAGTRNERGVADLAAKKLGEIGCRVLEDDVGLKVGGNSGNLFAVLEGTGEGSILFSAHMDRVANGAGIHPREENGRIVADGTILAADDISGIVAILEGLRRLRESGKPHPRIEVIFTICEEDGLLGSRYFDYSRVQSKVGFVFDSPGRTGRVINTAPARALMEVTVRGKSAHAGHFPERGINAVTVAARLLTRLQDGRIDPETTANFSVFQADGAFNVVNDHARLAGEVRSRSQEKLEMYLQEFQAACALVAEETGAVLEPRTEMSFEAFAVEEGSEALKILRDTYHRMGYAMLVEGGGGGMDANNYNRHGIQSVGVATGVHNNHSVEEYMVVEDLLRSGEFMEEIVRSYQNYHG